MKTLIFAVGLFLNANAHAADSQAQHKEEFRTLIRHLYPCTQVLALIDQGIDYRGNKVTKVRCSDWGSHGDVLTYRATWHGYESGLGYFSVEPWY